MSDTKGITKKRKKVKKQWAKRFACSVFGLKWDHGALYLNHRWEEILLVRNAGFIPKPGKAPRPLLNVKTPNPPRTRIRNVQRWKTNGTTGNWKVQGTTSALSLNR